MRTEDRSPERAREDYVKVIYQLAEQRPVRAVDLARYLGVTRASVSKFKRMLERQRLIEPARRRTDSLRLTPKGRRLALRMVRRHRLVETFLHAALRVPLERVHREAERIEHAISEDVSARLAAYLGHPARDPHGHPIFGRSRMARAASQLWDVSPGSLARVTSIDDREPVVVAHLARCGILPQSELAILRRATHRVVVRCGGRELVLPERTARAIWCRLLGSREAG